MRHRFFITCSAPNGTSDLIVTDYRKQVVSYHNEAVFGLDCRVEWRPIKGYVLALTPNDSIIRVKSDVNLEENECCQIVEVSKEDVLRHVACSPVNNGSEFASIINGL